MKLSIKHLHSLSKLFPPELYGILVYGPDAGHVSEVGEKIGKSHVEDLRDPFKVEELNVSEIKEDPARLADAAMSLPMTGGSKLIIIRECTDVLTSNFEELSRLESIEAKFLILSGALNPRSKLRKLFEDNKRLGALPCYTDQESDLKSLVSAVMAEVGISMRPDALQYLITYLGSDRLATRSELNKLILYAGNNKEITLQTVIEIVGDGGPMVLDAIPSSIANGDIKSFLIALDRHNSDSQNPISILRTTISYFQKLRTARALVDRGCSEKDAISALRPPIFWNKKLEFERQLKSWSAKQLNDLLERLQDAEILCKTTGYPAVTIASQVLLGLCIRGSKQILYR